MLPTLSQLSVSVCPGRRLRLWCSSRSLRISPLHREFHDPLQDSSLTVSGALLELSPRISPQTNETTYLPFTPNNSEQRLPPPYYRGCWHGVSRGFLWGYCQVQHLLGAGRSSPLTGVYNPKAFIPHAASLGQAFAHCPRFPTAASRRSLGRVSVPMWPIALSGRLPIAALVGRYPTN